MIWFLGGNDNDNSKIDNFEKNVRKEKEKKKKYQEYLERRKFGPPSTPEDMEFFLEERKKDKGFGWPRKL